MKVNGFSPIKKNGNTILTNTDIITFNTPKAPKEIISYSIEKVELFIPNPLRCQKFERHEDVCYNQLVCGKCTKKKNLTTIQMNV